MADVLTTDLSFVLRALWKDAQDLGNILDALAINLDDTLADGVGLDQADLLWHDERTLTAAAETLDLTALTRTVFGDSATVNFAKVKALLIKNKSTTAAQVLTVGAAATNAWTNWTSVVGSTFYVQPNGIEFKWAPDLAAWAVRGTNKNLKIDPGSATIVYRIAILGTSA